MIAIHKRQQGVFLLEALIAILIFSFGILGLVGMQSKAISAQSDAQYRIEAANYADKILGQIWSGVDRTTKANFDASLATYLHQPGGTNCKFTGAVSANQNVKDWVAAMTTGGGQLLPLPGATKVMQQIIVNPGSANQVIVNICWQAPFDNAPRRHTMITYIN